MAHPTKILAVFLLLTKLLTRQAAKWIGACAYASTFEFVCNLRIVDTRPIS